MTRNMGLDDRLIRLIVSVAVLAMFWIFASPYKYVTLVALFPLGTALLGYCPVYTHLGIDTHRGRSS
jgi:hypothetical protein